MDPLSWKDPLLEPRAMGGGVTGENMAFFAEALCALNPEQFED